MNARAWIGTAAVAAGLGLLVHALLRDAPVDGDASGDAARDEAPPAPGTEAPVLARSGDPAAAATRASAAGGAVGTCAVRGTVTRADAPVACDVAVFGVRGTPPGGVPVPALVAGLLDPTKPPIAAGRSAADGTFEISGLDPGTYDVIATAADGARGHAFARLVAPGETVRVACRIPTGEHSLRGRVTLADGTPWRGLVAVGPLDDDVAEFLAQASSALTDADGRFEVTGLSAQPSALAAVDATGVVGATVVSVPSSREVDFRLVPGMLHVRGRVTAAETGKPLEGAEVASAHDDTGLALATTKTDAEGRFRILAPPGAILRATAAGYGPATKAVWYPLDLGQGLKRLAQGFFGKDTTPAFDLALERAAGASGRVVTKEGRPVPGVNVSMTPLEGRAAAAAFAAATTVSGTDGRYEIREGPAGDVALFASGGGWISEGAASGSEDGYHPLARRIDPGDALAVDLVVVRTAAIEGVVVDAGSAPVGAATVRLEPDSGLPDEVRAFAPARTAATDAEGRFAFLDVLPDARFRLEASPPRGGALGRAQVLARSGETARVRIVLGSRRNVTVRVVAAEDGAPIAGAHVDLSHETGDESFVEGATQDGKTDATGHLAFSEAPAGEQVVWVSAAGRMPMTATVPSATNDPAPVVVVPLGRAVAVRGTVRTRDGRPVAGASVAAQSPYAYGSGTTDAEGRFAVDGHVEGAPTRVAAWSDGREGVALVRAGLEPADVVLEDATPATSATTTVVRVFGTDGEEDRSASVFVVGPDSDVDLVERDPESGELAAVLGAGARLLARGRSGAALQGPVRGGERRVDVHLLPGAEVRGTVRDEGGAGIVGIVVRARFADLPAAALLAADARTDGAGAFRIESLPAGDYVLSFAGPPDRPVLEERRVRAGGEPVDVVVPAGRIVTGQVVDAAGRGVAAQVWFARDGAGPPWETEKTESDGSFRVEHAPLRAFPLRVGFPGWSPEQAGTARTTVEAQAAHVSVRAPEAATVLVRLVGAPSGVRVSACLAPERAAHDADAVRQAAPTGDLLRFERTSDEDHVFWMGPFPDGSYASARGLRPGPEHRVELRKGLPARGRLVGAPTEATGLVRVWGPNVFCWTFVDPEGRFEFAGLPPGEHEFQAHVYADGAHFQGKGVIAPGSEAEVRVQAVE